MRDKKAQREEGSEGGEERRGEEAEEKKRAAEEIFRAGWRSRHLVYYLVKGEVS